MKLSKKVKMTFGAVLCSGLLGLLGTAHAGVTCEDATVVKTGVYPYTVGNAAVSYTVYATCNDTPSKWTGTLMFFVLKDDYADPLYAAALTAVSTGNTATMVVSTAADYGFVKMLSVKSAP